MGKDVRIRKPRPTEVAAIKARVSKGLSAWLTYEFICNRGDLFCEYYLAYPIGALLQEDGRHVFAEHKHPALIRPTRGRTPSLDFVVKEGEKMVLAVEGKWTGFRTGSPRHLIWDAFRLEAFCRASNGSGLLVLAGTQARILDMFGKPEFKRKSGTGTILPISSKKETIILRRNDLADSIQEFMRIEDEKFPGAIATSIYCSAPKHCIPNGPKSTSFAVYIWEIRPHPSDTPPRTRGVRRAPLAQSAGASQPTQANQFPADEKIFDAVKSSHGKAQARPLSNLTKYSIEEVRVSLGRLIAARRIRREGKTKGAWYIVNDPRTVP